MVLVIKTKTAIVLSYKQNVRNLHNNEDFVLFENITIFTAKQYLLIGLYCIELFTNMISFGFHTFLPLNAIKK
jgi:hypothetical protein